jgi:predicted hotdog family 3-hydroxylacyl-ACP dehydratase
MLRLTALLAMAAAGLCAATLERLSMDDMVAQSSDIVRARVVSSQAVFRGAASASGMIYTWYTIEVVDRWKGSGGQQMQVAVPGGVVQGLRQTIAGAPMLTTGQEYVLFIWTSRSGLPQIIGLAQGLFDLSTTPSGTTGLHRSAITEPMLDPVTKKQVTVQGVAYGYNELKSLVLSKLAGGTKQ